MITGQNILCISSIDWDFIWQGHQEIMSRLAAHGNRVLFVENTGVRPVRFRDLPRLQSRIRNWRRGTKGFREERPGLFVFSPLVLPFPYSRLARRINQTILSRALWRWMRAIDFHSPIAWTFLPTPLARDVLREVDPKLTVYYCIDDLRSSSHAARKITRTESEFFREADLVFVTSERLRERAARFSDRVHLFPFGVNYEAFERIRLGADEAPEAMRSLPRPIIGYVGGLHQFVDQQLVCAVADAMPEASVVLVGPVQTGIAMMQRRSNIHVLGARPHDELPRFIKAFDVALVPYHLNEYTSHVYPTKLNEYLAMGIPVVTTDLPEVSRFNAAYGDVVTIVRDPNAFASAVRAAVGTADGEAVERRLAVARDNSWSNRVQQMSVLIESALGSRPPVPWEEQLRRLYRTARRRAAQAVATVAAAYLLLFHTPLLWILAAPLHVAVPPVPAEVVVVFGGGVGESGRAGGGYQERVKQAVNLYHAGFARRIVLSSGFVFAFEEAEVMKTLTVSLGVPPDDIVLEKRAASTYDNVRFVRLILNERGWNTILLVSSPYHMRRALLTWRKLGPEVTVVPTPVQDSQFYQHGLGASSEQVRGVVHEYAAIVYYWWRGWL